jgi:aspartate/methionine/tyrosine aminotransferase
MKHYTTICNSGPSEFLATIALKHSDELLTRNRLIIEENIKVSNKFFDKHNKLFTTNHPKAGPIAFHRINIDVPIEEFVIKTIEDVGVLLLGANVYNMNEPYIRMGYGRKNFKESLQVFDDYLVKLKSITI